MPFIIKINVRSSDTGASIRTLRRFNNFVYHKIFNSLASTFSFDLLFDPQDKEQAELICVSHMHECQLYFTKNTDSNHIPLEKELEYTGYLLRNTFRNNGKPQWVSFSSYSKPGVLLDCDIPPEGYPLETEGLTFRQIITQIIKPFNLGLVIDKGATGVNKRVIGSEDKEEDPEAEYDKDMGKTACEIGQNIASYLSELARSRNIVLSHNSQGNVYITTPNTKGPPIFNFDLIDKSPNGDANKIPGLDMELVFNGQALHTHITVKMQASDEEDSNGREATLTTPLLPIGPGHLYRPRVMSISSGDEFTVEQAAKYELGREIREAINLRISIAIIEIDGKLLSPNNILSVRDPSLFLYNISDWFIQDVEFKIDHQQETCVLNCVLPFGYDYNLSRLKNVFVEHGEDVPRI